MLCDLWGSDFRTNTIDEKYAYFQNRLGWIKTETERLLGGHQQRMPMLAWVYGGAVTAPIAVGLQELIEVVLVAVHQEQRSYCVDVEAVPHQGIALFPQIVAQ